MLGIRDCLSLHSELYGVLSGELAERTTCFQISIQSYVLFFSFISSSFSLRNKAGSSTFFPTSFAPYGTSILVGHTSCFDALFSLWEIDSLGTDISIISIIDRDTTQKNQINKTILIRRKSLPETFIWNSLSSSVIEEATQLLVILTTSLHSIEYT